MEYSLNGSWRLYGFTQGERLIEHPSELENTGITAIEAHVPGNVELDMQRAEGNFVSPANQNWQVARIRTYATDQRLFLIEWHIDTQTFGNHYLSGTPPLSLETYKGQLPKIASIPIPFDATLVSF
ncbi:MAG TPA: hypothetical protein PLI09_21765 [Candidatus Hydrogenedentes bacterium]|nr:hypothetical protein [Candidatus Hydrogenedentota bacterium]